MDQQDPVKEEPTSPDDHAAESGLDERNIIMGARDNFTGSSISVLSEEFSIDKLDKKLVEFETAVFGNPSFTSDKKIERRRARTLQEEAVQSEKSAEQERRKATAFQFDFGYLDAEVHGLLHQLNSVFCNDVPMPDAPTTKSLYSTTKSNIKKIGDTKIILSRICFIGRLKDEMAERQETCDDKFTKIRERTDSIFARELGVVTGCLLRYPEYFVVLLEGPEISIMDVVLQAKRFCDEVVEEGRVLFIADQIMVRFLNDWTSLSLNPLYSVENIDDADSGEGAKDKLKLLGEQCVRFWKALSYAKRNDFNTSQFMSSYNFPPEQLLSYCVRCDLLRDLHSWINSLTELPSVDLADSGRPQAFYPVQFTAFKTDSQFDSLGVLGCFDNLPGTNPQLEAFLNTQFEMAFVEKDDQEVDFKQTLI